LDRDEGANVFLETLNVEVQTCGSIHVREVKHDCSELMAILIDRCALGEATEAIIGVGGNVDRDELLPQGNHEVEPRGGVCVVAMPDEILRIGPVPEGSIFLEKGGGEGDTAMCRDGEELAILFHLEDPGFQGLPFLPGEGRGAVGFQIDDALGFGVGWGCGEGVEAFFHSFKLGLEVTDHGISRVFSLFCHWCVKIREGGPGSVVV
jgi:hypothetical protein